MYGTTTGSGAHGDGEVFSLPINGGTPTILTSFNYADGDGPSSGNLTLSGNTLYGTTGAGGTGDGTGTVFSLPIIGGTPTVLASIGYNIDGQDPEGGLILSGSTLYGTTFVGGAYSNGEVFSVPVTGGTPTILASFNGADGAEPNGVIISGSTLYGTTRFGGANAAGVIFSLPITGGTPNVVASFNYDWGYPSAGLLLSGSTLYGTTSNGGAYGDGTVFSLPIPEPASLALLVLGGMPLLLRRNHRKKI